MRWFAGDIVRGIVRWIIPTIISAIFIVWGIAPSAIIAALIQSPPAWVLDPRTRLVVVFFGFGVLPLFYLWRQRQRSRLPLAVSGIELRETGYAGFFDETNRDALSFLFGDNFRLVTITNRSATDSVALDIWLHARADNLGPIKFLADAEGPLGLRLGVDDRVGKALQNQGRPPLEYFKCPVVLKPQEIARRRLEFLQYGGFLQDGRTSLRDALNHHMREFKYEIEIIDHVSGRSIRIPVPGEYRG